MKSKRSDYLHERSWGLRGYMQMMLLLVHTTLVVYVACTQVVAVDSVTLALSGDAVPTDAPGEYVVPERGNVTFTCNSSSVAPTWKVDLKTLGSTADFSNTKSLLSELQNVSSSDTGSFPNPTSFTVHNIPTESNGSYVECSAQGRANSIARIFVEGSPNCPSIQTSFTKVDSLAVSIHELHKTWLTVCYNVEVTSTNMTIVTMHNSTITSDGFLEVKSLQPDTVYNISVTPCNMAGCNKSCDLYSVQKAAVPTEGVLDPGGVAVGDPFVTIGLPIIAVAVLAILTVLVSILLTYFYRRRRLRGKQKKGGTEQGGIEDKSRNTTEYAQIVTNTTSAKGNSLQGPTKTAHTSAP